MTYLGKQKNKQNMDDWFKFSTDGFLSIILTAVGIYLALIILTRINGKRSFLKCLASILQ